MINSDAENRLKSIQYTDGASVVHRIEYVYGANGFVGILKKYENSILVNETRMVRDGFLELQERDQNNAITREYVWGMNLGGGIGGLLSMRQQGQNYHYLYDGKGNVSAVLDGNQQIVASYRYDTFGRLMAKSGTLDQPFQFSTKYYDQQTGLNYYGYRFYSPVLGRWVNRDPLGEAGGVNLYGFVGNNPVNWIDPTGLATWYYGYSSSVYLGNYVGNPAGSATAGAGAIGYSNETGWFGGNYGTSGAQADRKGKWDTLGLGIGIGPVMGFFTGSICGFSGPTDNYNFDFWYFGFTYSQNSSGWGLSGSWGGRVIGLGYYFNKTTTKISPNRGCK